MNKIKLIFFDMDGVLVDIGGYNENGKKVAASIWNILFDQMGIYHEHERLKEKFLKRKFPSYMDWTNEACAVLQKNGLTEEKFMKIINSRSLMEGAEETLQELKKRGYKTAVISGGFKALAERVQKILGLDYIVAHCDLSFNKNGNLKGWQLIPCDFEGKADYFDRWVKEENLNPLECAYIGDEVNDIPIFKKAGLSIAFNCQKEEVKRCAHITIKGKHLRGILQYLP
jgi:phosphoserine phosphatase